jgi:hypothetical protein
MLIKMTLISTNYTECHYAELKQLKNVIMLSLTDTDFHQL